MSKHTPGPWDICTWAQHMPLPGWPCCIASASEDGEPGDGPTVCMFHQEDVYEFGPEEVRANARLIAASPDLLAACLRVIEDADCRTPDEGPPRAYVAWCRAAIAKAKGAADAGK